MLLSWTFISSYTSIYFFVKKFIFSNVYFSEDTIFDCLYMFFWLRKGPSIKYLRKLETDGVIQNAFSCIQEEGVSRLICTYALSLFMFWQHSCFIVSCFICRNLTLPLFKKDLFVRDGYFPPTRSISVVMK